MSRERKRKESIDLNELKELREASPVKTWVNLLLLHISRESVNSFTLNRSNGIPPIPFDEEVPPGGFDFDKIINRLKVMSNLDPVHFKTPRKGAIHLTIHGIQCKVDLTFFDSQANSRCEMTMHKG